jgi:hypothetical protein
MNVNVLAWYATRKLSICPPHFVKCTTPVTEKTLLWVMSKLHGRYTLEEGDDDDFMFVSIRYISFEDPAEAMLYELRWSGTK